MRRSAVLCAWLFALGSPITLACGYCVEDKIAAVYDHAVITRALERGHRVAFFSIEAESAGQELRRAIQTTLEAEPAIDRGTIRVSLPGAALSFAYDPARRGLGPITRALDRRIAGKGSTVSLLRVIDEAERAR